MGVSPKWTYEEVTLDLVGHDFSSVVNDASQSQAIIFPAAAAAVTIWNYMRKDGMISSSHHQSCEEPEQERKSFRMHTRAYYHSYIRVPHR